MHSCTCRGCDNLDTHFMQRDRMGRLVTFLARIEKAWGQNTGRGILGIGISEHSAAVLSRSSGLATLSGVGPIYFLRTYGRHAHQCEDGHPLDWPTPGVSVWKWNGTSASFNFSSWTPEEGTFDHYSLYVNQGTLLSTQTGGGIY